MASGPDLDPYLAALAARQSFIQSLEDVLSGSRPENLRSFLRPNSKDRIIKTLSLGLLGFESATVVRDFLNLLATRNLRQGTHFINAVVLYSALKDVDSDAIIEAIRRGYMDKSVR